MSGQKHSWSARLVLHLTAGVFLILLAVLIDPLLGKVQEWGRLQSIIIAGGILMVTAGFLSKPAVLALLTHRTAAATVCLFVAIALCETLCRLVGLDFAREEQAWRRVPVFYRQPMLAHAEVFFRRAGPLAWSGRVLSTRMVQLGISPNPYQDESQITVAYDETGFRNRVELTEWSLAIAGDSYTELGHLSDQFLFTSVIGRELGVDVKNLGTSFTGPLTHLSYLQSYGISAGTRHVMVVFFEGNDVADLQREDTALRQWEQSGQRPYREFRKQTSMIRGLYRLLTRMMSSRYENETRGYVDAYFQTSSGELPLTLGYLPANPPPPNSKQMKRLERFLDSLAQLMEKHDVTAGLVFMPCKRRVMHQQVRFSDSAPESMRGWQARGFPGMLEGMCTERALQFIDLTPTLMKETRLQGKLMYNAMWDSHINADGARVVGQAIAQSLRKLYPVEAPARPSMGSDTSTQ